MLSVDEARTRILARLAPVAAETVALSRSWGRVLAQPVTARLTQPPADVSAMDGYAVRAADSALGARLRVVGHAPAGRPFAGEIRWGEAVRLFTGSVIPRHADCVLLQEDASAEGETVVVREAPRLGQHIRPMGQDFALGDALLQPGIRLGARDVGLAAAANHAWIAVHRRPRIAILATGDEIAMPGDPLGAGGIVSSNSLALAALVRAGGGEPWLLPIARDDAEAIGLAARSASGADMLVTTGGASVGDHDLVQAGLAAQGFALDFWKIAMRPGKPMMFGALGGMPVLGLPGNPVSAYVCALLFLLPALQRLAGRSPAPLATIQATLGAPLKQNDHRTDHLRATLSRNGQGGLMVTPFERQDSGLLRSLADAHALIQRPPHAPPLPAGVVVDIISLDNLGL